jgi:hypothetical protein
VLRTVTRGCVSASPSVPTRETSSRPASHLQILSRCAFEQVVQAARDDDALARALHLHAADTHAMSALDVRQHDRVALEAHEPLTLVPRLEQRPHVARGQWRRERHGRERENAREPRRGRGRERDVQQRRAGREEGGEVPARFALVDSGL